MLSIKLSAYKRLKNKLRSKIPCRGYKFQQFQEMCRSLHIDIKRVEIYESYYVTTPMLAGVLHPAVILPVEKYTKQELDVIFAHELTHYRQRNILLKHMAAFILSLGWFNPFVYYYCSLVEEWSEYACDSGACECVGNKKEYFTIILDLAKPASDACGFLSAPLVEKKYGLTRRVKKMLLYQSVYKRSKKAVVIMCIAVVAISFSTVSVISIQAANLYEAVYHATEVSFEEEYNPPEKAVEYVESVDLSQERTLQVYTEELEWNKLSKSGNVSTTFHWTVYNNSVVESDFFYVSAGQTVSVSGYIDPTGREVKVGICSSAGIRQYIVAENGYYHDFYINESENYWFFVENESGVSVTVDGQIYIRAGS